MRLRARDTSLMRSSELVAIYEQTKAKACETCTWRLKVRLWLHRKRVHRHKREVDQLRIVAIESVLKRRYGLMSTGPGHAA